MPDPPNRVARVIAGTSVWGEVGRVARLLLVCALPLVIAIHLIASAITGAQLQDLREDLAREGILVSAAVLVPTVPPGERNAYDLYLAAANSLRLSKDEEVALFYPDERDDDYYALARRVIDANRPYYGLVGQATRLEHCAFPIDWTMPAWEQDSSHLSVLRLAARLLILRAQTAAHEGRADDALASLGAVYRVAEHMKAQPDGVGYFEALRLQTTAVSALAQVLSRSEPSAAAARSLAQQLAALEYVDSSIRAMKGDLVLSTLPLFDEFRTGRVPIAEWTEKLGGLGAWAARPLANRSERHCLLYMEGQVAAAKLPWPESHTESRRLERELRTSDPLAYDWRLWSSEHLVGRERRIAAVRAAQIALVLSAHRADYGSYPEGLADLSMDDWTPPADPFGGGPFRYRREGAGFVVWSIGPDMEDGLAALDYADFSRLPQAERDTNPYGYDIVFRCR